MGQEKYVDDSTMHLFLGPCFVSGGTLLFPLLIFLFSLFPPAPPLYLFFFLHLRRNSSEDKGDDDEGPLFCDVSGQAAYPTMKVIDARSALLSPHELYVKSLLYMLVVLVM